MKAIGIMGSTGSIGTQCLDVVRELRGRENIRIITLCCDKNIKLLEEQVREFKPLYAVVVNKALAKEFKEKIKDTNTKVLEGTEGIIEACTDKEIDIVVNSVVGVAGLVPTIECIKAGKDIALANKETLVTAGEIIMKLIKEENVRMLPVDSEHSAIFQSLQGNGMNKIEKILLTASGGPFRGYSYEKLQNVTLDQALNHPNWAMGNKITLDSATLMNKGLEVIEAKWLFNVEPKDIEVVVHPQSVIHSAVQYEDGSIIAQLGRPDMKLPIQYALQYPNRIKNSFKRLNLFDVAELTFEKPDMDNFKCLRLAFRAIEAGGNAPAALNGANEQAVKLYFEGKITFLQIGDLIEETLNLFLTTGIYKKINISLEDVLASDSWAREKINNLNLNIKR